MTMITPGLRANAARFAKRRQLIMVTRGAKRGHRACEAGCAGRSSAGSWRVAGHGGSLGGPGYSQRSTVKRTLDLLASGACIRPGIDWSLAKRSAAAESGVAWTGSGGVGGAAAPGDGAARVVSARRVGGHRGVERGDERERRSTQHG